MTTTNNTPVSYKVAEFQKLFRDAHLAVSAYATEGTISEAFGQQFAQNSTFVNTLKNCLGSLNADSFKTARNLLKSLLVTEDESGENSQPLGKWHNILSDGKLVYAFYQPKSVDFVSTFVEPEPTPAELYEVYKKAMPAFVIDNEELLGQAVIVQLVKLAWQNRKRSNKVVEQPMMYFWVAGNVVSGSGFAPVSEVLSAMPLRLFNSNVNFENITSSFTVNPPVELHIPVARNSTQSAKVDEVARPTIDEVLTLLQSLEKPEDNTTIEVTVITPRHDNDNNIIDYALQYLRNGRKLTMLFSGLKSKVAAKAA